MVYRTKVTDILIEEDRAIGLELDARDKVYGDIVISAADGHETIYDLLHGRYLDRKTQDAYEGGMTPSKSILQISLDVAMDFSAFPPMISMPLAEPIWLGNLRHDRLVIKHYCFDPTMAPRGKSVLTLWCEADYDYWTWLRRDEARYK